MLKRLVLLVLAAALAWQFGPLLSVVLWFIPFAAIASFLVPDDLGEKSIVDWVQFALWLVVFWFLLPRLLSLFNFAVPNAQRYTETKAYRRVQGFLAETLPAAVIAGAWLSVLTQVPTERDLVARNWARAVYLESEPQEKAKRHQALKEREEQVQRSLAAWNAAGAEHNRLVERFLENDRAIEGKRRRSEYIETELASLADGSWKPLAPPLKVKTAAERKRELQSERTSLATQIEELEAFAAKKNLMLGNARVARGRAEDTLHEHERERDAAKADLAALGVDGAYHRSLIPMAAEAFAASAFTDRAWLVLRWGRFPLLVLFLVSYGAFLYYRRDAADGLARLARVMEQGRYGLGGSSRFAGLLEEWALSFWKQPDALYLGRSLFNPLLDVGLADARHMLTIAGSRAGKGVSAIIPNLLLWEGSALVIDPKGTNAAVTARHRGRDDRAVHVVDPFDVLGKGECAGLNPLSLLDPASPTIREEVSIIADALVVSDPLQRERHWDDGARSIIAGLIGHLISSPTYTEPRLSMLRDLLTMLPEEQAVLWADMSLNAGAGGLPRDAAARVIRGLKTNEILGILSNADKHTEWLSSPAIRRALDRTTFRFSDLKARPTTIFLVLPPHLLETHNRFLRLMVNLAMAQMSVGGRSSIPVLMLLDEFLALGRMTEVEKAFGLMAGYNLTIWPFVQDLGRLKDLYGSSVNAFITNSRAVQVFGVFDEETTGFVSKTLGNRAISSVWGTLDERRRGVPLRDPSEVARDIEAGSGRQYVLRAGRAPLIIERVPYFTPTLRDTMRHGLPLLGMLLIRPQFQGKFDPDPDYAS